VSTTSFDAFVAPLLVACVLRAAGVVHIHIRSNWRCWLVVLQAKVVAAGFLAAAHKRNTSICGEGDGRAVNILITFCLTCLHAPGREIVSVTVATTTHAWKAPAYQSSIVSAIAVADARI